MKLTEQAYTKLIEQDLAFINKHLPDSLETDHIKVVLCNSIDMHYSNTISQMQPEWVACSDQLPPSMEHVLCYVNGEVHSRLFSRELIELSNEEFIERCQVTHWMPLPSPPNTAS